MRDSVIIEENGLERIGSLLRNRKAPGKAAVLADTNVLSLYGEEAKASLREAGFTPCLYAFPAGEQAKTPEMYVQLLCFLAENRLSRSDTVLALGGGVAGDMAGFAAATYLRGIDLVQLPTSLLAMIDSSVGGKTGIDLPQGKNLAGAFWHPLFVLADPALLNTLPEREWRCGLGEMLKYALISGEEELFRLLKEQRVKEDRETAIRLCLEIKQSFAEKDPLDKGERRKLNFGHTFGHAIEKCSDYRLSHGEAVAAGMALITRAAEALGYCSADFRRETEDMLALCGLPLRTDYTAEELAKEALSDKKAAFGRMHLVVPRGRGKMDIAAVPPEELIGWARAGGAL